MLPNRRRAVSSLPAVFHGAANILPITFDPAKRDWTLRPRAPGIAAAATVFAGSCVSFQDDRQDYGETRIITIGMLAGRMLAGRMVVVGWTLRGDDEHVFPMRKANDREQKKYGPALR